ncbi:unnamed protein product, partial [Ascophyllum nodosum]
VFVFTNCCEEEGERGESEDCVSIGVLVLYSAVPPAINWLFELEGGGRSQPNIGKNSQITGKYQLPLALHDACAICLCPVQSCAGRARRQRLPSLISFPRSPEAVTRRR